MNKEELLEIIRVLHIIKIDALKKLGQISQLIDDNNIKYPELSSEDLYIDEMIKLLVMYCPEYEHYFYGDDSLAMTLSYTDCRKHMKSVSSFDKFIKKSIGN